MATSHTRNIHYHRCCRSTHSSQATLQFHQKCNLSSIPYLELHHTHRLPTLLHDEDKDSAIVSQSDDDSSISSTDSPRREWDLEEWSDEEILNDLDNLEDCF
jgi:hypothetical protein